MDSSKTAPSTEEFSVNGRTYRPPARPLAVICIDGCADEYLNASLARGRMPVLARLLASGAYRAMARGALPSFTNDMNRAIQAVKGIQTGTVNINQVPGYRIECSPFGGVKDSGLGVKEGVIEAMKGMTYVKTFSMPW